MATVISRRFRLWDYNVSHDQLLLRSPKDERNLKNVDIIFWKVEYVELTSRLIDVQPVFPTDEEVSRLSYRLRKMINKNDIHVLESHEGRSVVVAAGYKVVENELDIFESSLEFFRPAGNDIPD